VIAGERMNDKSLVLTAYSHEPFLPCELKEIVAHVKRKKITSRSEKVGLKKDVTAVPFNRGYLLRTKELVLLTNTIQPFYKINGKYTVDELNNTTELESSLQQLHYYDLLLFGSNNGRLLVKDVPKKYKELYKKGDFVTFPLVPINVELNLTNACNFACIHCSKDSKPKRKINSERELSTKEHQNIIDECAQIGVPKLTFMGGEPLYYQDFFKLVKYAKEKGIRNVETSTNGWFINDNTAKELSKYFNNIQVSVHGVSSSTHDSIVGRKGAWEQAQRAIKALKKYNLKVNVSFTIMRENVDDIYKMPYLVKDWGGDSLRFICLNNQEGRGRLLKGWNVEEIFQIGSEIKKIYESLPPSLELEAGGFPPLHAIKNDACSYGCSAGKTLLVIESDGRVGVCGGLDKYIGNVKEKSILDIWHSPELIEMRKQSKCDCDYRPICYGQCLIGP
jgi:radical SAM protein with 4Fe4S-binding SPASM domain